MAKGRKTSLAARGLALLFAIALVSLAAKLWLGSTSEADLPPAETGRTFVETEPRAEDAVPAGPPPQHGEIGAEDRAALREILRDSQTEPE